MRVLRVVTIVAGVSMSGSVAASADPAEPDTTRVPTYEDVRRSIRNVTDHALGSDALHVDPVHRDSVVAAFDARVRRDGLEKTLRGHGRLGGGTWRSGLSTDFQAATLTYSKVDGITLGMPIEWGLAGPGLRARVGGLVAYAFASEGTRFRQGATVTWSGVEWSAYLQRLTVPFGWTRVHGTRVFALAGADEQHYLERRAWSLGVALPLESARVKIEYENGDDRSLRAKDIVTLTDEEGIGARNPTASRGDQRTFRLRINRNRLDHPRFFGSLVIESAGRGLGGDFSYDRVLADVERTVDLPTGDDLALRVQAQVAAGPTVPLQALADPAGRSGIRGYPQSALLGTHALSAHVDLHVERDVFAMLRVPVLRNLRLQLVPFADVGAAWTPARNRELADAVLPTSSDWKWGSGIGIRRNVGFGHLLSHVRLDAAWRLDRRATRPVFYFVLEGEPFD